MSIKSLKMDFKKRVPDEKDYITLAEAYYFLYRIDKRLKCLENGVKFLKNINKDQLSEADRGDFLNVNGMIHQGISEHNNNDQKEAKEALESYQKALIVYTKLYNQTSALTFKGLMANLQNNIGQMYIYLLNDPGEGIRHINKAKKTQKEANDGRLVSENFIWNLADGYKKLGQTTELRNMFEEDCRTQERFFTDNPDLFRWLRCCRTLHQEKQDKSIPGDCQDVGYNLEELKKRCRV